MSPFSQHSLQGQAPLDLICGNAVWMQVLPFGFGVVAEADGACMLMRPSDDSIVLFAKF